ncbi:MAG TPA: transcriptional regulator [Acidobacteriaceae bacterium]|nr:transcriptional regulator [Acidobacteriaceae bacterium]
MNRKSLSSLLVGLATLAMLCPSLAGAAPTRWLSVGPAGGDARSFTSSPSDPHHLYLGTSNSWIYQSMDNGATWTRLAELGTVDDLVIDNLLVDEVDPKTLYAGVWRMDRMDGGIYISHDGGQSWVSSAGIQGQSVRALAQAPSNPKVLVAGAIGGVFRSEDGGIHWTQISPQGSGEISKVESIAIDPSDPRTIYAGTWHLPWKTTDGGATWHNIKEGLIVDSDVFSIILDPKFPSTVYLSACSGIYKSENGGELFRKVQGIPSTARRTRVLMQDPTNRNIVYAGTTEGLYKTEDGGTNWARMTTPNLIINDIYVDPANPRRVLLATDRSGVMASNDAGSSFVSANHGFSQRQVTALISDSRHPETMYAGVINDKLYGGVFVTHDGGSSWAQHSGGLDGLDVFTLAQSPSGGVYAGTERGVFRWTGESWLPDNHVVNLKTRTTYTVRHHRKIPHTVVEGRRESTIDSQVNDLSTVGSVWFAATTAGVYRSADHGETWEGPVLDRAYRFVDAHDDVAFAASRTSLRLSDDHGVHWTSVMLPGGLSSIEALASTPAGVLWVGGREGAFYSQDHGQTWHALNELPVRDIDNINYDDGLGRVVITSRDSDLIFALNPDNKSWKWWNAGWKVRMVHSVNGRLVGASLYDGVVVQPRADGVATSEQALR